MEDATPWPAVPGPVDPESFRRAQRRHRRARFWFGCATAVSTVVTGSPMAIMISPYLLIVAVLAMDLANFVVPMPDPYPAFLDAVGLEESTDTGLGDLAVVTGVLLASGGVTAMLSWLLLRRFLRIGGRAGMLTHLGARPPRPDDLRETRFVNAVEEIAVAAGIRPPQVAIGGARNAAVFGSSRRGYVVVVNPALLHSLSRDELQGIAAYLVASAGNGDLGMAITTSSAMLVNDFAPIVLSWPFSRRARSLLWRLLRPSKVNPEEFHDTVDALGDMDNSLVGDSNSGFLAAAASMLGILAWLMNLVTQMVALCVVRPWLGAFWRHRSALADIGAVQLTRHPDGLANAVRWIGGSAIGRPGSGSRAALEQRLSWLPPSTQDAGSVAPLEHLTMVVGDEAMAAGFRNDGSGWGMLAWPAVRPKLHKRLRRLRRLGAHVPVEEARRPTSAADRRAAPRPTGRRLVAAYAKVAGVLVALLALLPCGVALILQAMFLAIYLTLCAAATLVAPVHYLLRALAG